jgi:hypothetical protein
MKMSLREIENTVVVKTIFSLSPNILYTNISITENLCCYGVQGLASDCSVNNVHCKVYTPANDSEKEGPLNRKNCPIFLKQVSFKLDCVLSISMTIVHFLGTGTHLTVL